MQNAPVRAMVSALSDLLSRAQPTPEAAVPFSRWAEARREADRLKVEVDLLKLELEDLRNAKS